MKIQRRSSTALRKRRRTLVRDLPPIEQILRGSLIETYKRCGRPNCHCVDGPGHGPKRYLSMSQEADGCEGTTCQTRLTYRSLSSSTTFANGARCSTRFVPSTQNFSDAARISDRSPWI